MIKVLLLLSLACSLGKSQENFEPDSVFNENFQNIGPTSIHSIKGKFYEEKQRKVNSKPNVHSEDVSNLNPKLGSNSQLQHQLAKRLHPDPPTEFGTLPRLNKNDNEYKHTFDDRRKPIFETINNSHKNLQRWDINDADSKISIIERNLKEPTNTHFHSENVVSNYENNNTIETIKKELVFDSLLIKNNINNFTQAPTNIINSHTSPGNNSEEDSIIESNNPILLQLGKPNRRYSTNAYYNVNNDSVPTDPSQKPRQSKTNNKESFDFEHTDYDYPNTDKSDAKPLLKQSNYVIDKDACEEKEISDEMEDRSGYEIQLQDPTKGVGISNVGKSRVMLMDHPRVCYACSSINDPSCWSPDRRTAVKYCRTDHQSCVTKFYKYKGLSYIIRDCGTTCQQIANAGPTKYTTCTICHHDLCNSAHTFKIHNFTMFSIFIIHSVFIVIKRLC